MKHLNRLSFAAVFLGLVSLVPGCSSKLSGTSSSYLLIDSLKAASIQSQLARTFNNELESDVCVSNGTGCTVFDDIGQVTLSMSLKDPGAQLIANVPTELNFITVTRYRVVYVRSDGRNTPGVDVPFPFDGGLAFTIGLASNSTDFTIVRVQAKEEAPLRSLRSLGGAVAITTIAQITFYGTDQTGRAVSVTGNINVTFADWADPQ